MKRQKQISKHHVGIKGFYSEILSPVMYQGLCKCVFSNVLSSEETHKIQLFSSGKVFMKYAGTFLSFPQRLRLKHYLNDCPQF